MSTKVWMPWAAEDSHASSFKSVEYICAPTDGPPPTAIAVKKRVNFATVLDPPPPQPPVNLQFEIPYTTIDPSLRSDAFSPAKRDTPPVNRVLDDVPATVLPAIRLYFEGFGNHAKIDYSHTAELPIITRASREHHFTANIDLDLTDPDLLGLPSSNANSQGTIPITKLLKRHPPSEEFYPTPPAGMLTLTSAGVLTMVPPQLAAKSLDIPFTILYEHFRKITGEDTDEPEHAWGLSCFPGMKATDDRRRLLFRMITRMGALMGVLRRRWRARC
ncbi:hypothetical protein Q9L58_006516 [Maublancomyces gigas]|uniref:Uncharacterized protein n=1 Tax=Discina gigas TaxID=1032678 RepID=A0ABR3GFM8_9PEZI